MFIEHLEARIAPAAVVSLNLIGTSLKISYSTASLIGIVPDIAGGIDVIASTGETFTLNGSPLSTIPNFSGTAVSLSGHHIGSISFTDTNPADVGDSITLDAPVLGSVSISLAGLGNTVNILTSQINGGLSVKTPAGGTIVSFMDTSSTLIGGPVKLALGLAGSSVLISTPSVEVDGSFSDIAGPLKPSAIGIGANSFVVNQSGGGGLELFKVAGALTFNSKFAQSHFSISTANVEIGGNLSITTTGSVSGQTDGIPGGDVSIGGNVKVNVNGAQPFVLETSFLTVAGQVTVLEGGPGNVSITSAGGLGMGSLTVSGHSPGTFTLMGSLEPSAGTGIVGEAGLSIGGGVKLSGFSLVNVSALGVIGGSFSATGISEINVDVGLTGSGGHLAIGGSFLVSAPPPPASGPAVPSDVTVWDVVVGGSFRVTGNSAGGLYALTDDSIFGSASFNLGAKVNGPGQALSITETFNDHQMFIGGAFTASLGAGGNVTFSDNNSPSDILVYGPATFTEPAVNNLMLTLPTTLFALPIKLLTSK